KYLVPVPAAPHSTKPRRLRCIYALHAAPDGDAANLTQIRGVAALEVLMQNVYRLGLAQAGHKATAFALCAVTARDVPVFRFSRPLGFDVLDEGVEFLQDHLHDIR